MFEQFLYHSISKADTQKVKTDLSQLPSVDGLHSPHGQTNFLPPKKESQITVI